MPRLETREFIIERAHLFREQDDLDQSIGKWTLFLLFGYLFSALMLFLTLFYGFHIFKISLFFLSTSYIIVSQVKVRKLKKEKFNVQEKIIFLRSELENNL
ncbi:hypothetical protein [Neobacillus sp. LXY-4]|uniref:hypothetical protein n=1 Tax=Neobacillus sp. LXY-4 TaxID=3379826 RepID=UPI003EE2C7E7